MTTKTKKRDSYQSFRSKPNKKKRLCNDSLEFKLSKKWYGYDEKYFDYTSFVRENEGKPKAVSRHHRVFCPCCGRTKTLFSSEKKADNFIKFNSEAIETQNGYAPVRSYFCPLCGGWHITSINENFRHSRKTWAEKTLDQIQRIDEERKLHRLSKQHKRQNHENYHLPF